MVELQRQLELKDSTIASLRKVIEQKDEQIQATEAKLKGLEEKRDEIEEALLSLTIDSNDNPMGTEGHENDEIDTFVTSNSRAAQLEMEKNDLRVKLATLSSTVFGFCTQFKNSADLEFNLEEAVKQMEESCNSLMLKNCSHQMGSKASTASSPETLANHSDVCGQNSENTVTQLQVRMELEHERRLRTQADLDESEKKHVILKRELDSKARRNEDLAKQLVETKEKCEVRIKQVNPTFGRIQSSQIFRKVATLGLKKKIVAYQG